MMSVAKWHCSVCKRDLPLQMAAQGGSLVLGEFHLHVKGGFGGDTEARFAVQITFPMHKLTELEAQFGEVLAEIYANYRRMSHGERTPDKDLP